MQKTRGLSLTELLISLLVIGVVMAATMGLLYAFFGHFSQSDDYSAARQRAEMVLTILEKPVLMTGLGIPLKGGMFVQSFKNSTNNNLQNLGSAIKIMNANGKQHNDLRLLYALPSGRASTSEWDLASGDTPTISLTSGDPLSAAFVDNNKGETRGWVIFPHYGYPLGVETRANDSVKVIANISGKIAFFDELHFLRNFRIVESADSIYTYDGYFVLDSQTTPLLHRRVDGIVGLYADYQAASGILTVWVMARGERKANSPYYTQNRILEWVGGTIDIPDFNTNRYYRLAVAQAKWRVRN